METTYGNILLSQPFTFVVGPKKQEFTVHGAALSRLSKSLNDLLSGPMREAKERRVHWEDVDEKTFVRFSQWAYTRNYAPAEPDILLGASCVMLNQGSSRDDLMVEDSQEPSLYSLVLFKVPNKCEDDSDYETHFCCDNCGYDQPVGDSVKKILQTRYPKRLDMIEEFNTSNEFPSPTIPFTPRRNTDGCEDYTEVFLSHARLYTLADKYDITELRNLTLHKLHVTLKDFTLYPSRIGDITRVVRYAFENTIEGDKLRILLVDYCTCIVEDMVETEDFKEVMTEVPDFGFELIKKVADRLA